MSKSTYGTFQTKTLSGSLNSTGISGGSAGQVLYQSSASNTSFTNAADGVLQSNGTTPSFSALSLAGTRVTGILPLTKGGTGSSTLTGITGSGNIVADTSPTLITPNIGSATGTSLNAGGSVMNSGGFQVGNALHSSTAYSIATAGNALPFYSEVSGADSYNLLNIKNSTGNTNVFIGQGNAGTPGTGSLVSQRGVFWTSGANPIDIVPNNQNCFTAKTDGTLKFYQYPSANFLYTDSTGNVLSGISPKFRAYLGVNQTLPSNSQTLINIDPLLFSVGTGWNGTTHRYVPTVAGYYQCSATINFGTAAGEYSTWIIKNGTPIVARSTVHVQNATTIENYVSCSGLTYFNGTTDYIELQASNTTGVTLIANPDFVNFMACLIP